MIRESLHWWVLERSSLATISSFYWWEKWGLVIQCLAQDYTASGRQGQTQCQYLEGLWEFFFNDYYFVKDKLSKKGKEKKKSHIKHLFWVQASSIMVVLKPKKNTARPVIVPFHPRGNWVPERPSLRTTQLSNRAGTGGTPACDHKGFSLKRATLPGWRKSHWQQDWIFSHTKSPGEERRASL